MNRSRARRESSGWHARRAAIIARVVYRIANFNVPGERNHVARAHVAAIAMGAAAPEAVPFDHGHRMTELREIQGDESTDHLSDEEGSRRSSNLPRPSSSAAASFFFSFSFSAAGFSSGFSADGGAGAAGAATVFRGQRLAMIA
jgi:hypothetical protein